MQTMFNLNARVRLTDGGATGWVCGTAVQHLDRAASLDGPTPLVLVMLDKPIEVSADCVIRIMPAHVDNLCPIGRDFE